MNRSLAMSKRINKACANKWTWSWLEKKFDDVPFVSWCQKQEEASKAYFRFTDLTTLVYAVSLNSRHTNMSQVSGVFF